MCSLFALVQTNIGRNKEELHLDTTILAQSYKQWWLSRPFDCGETTGNGLQPLMDECSLEASKNSNKILN